MGILKDFLDSAENSATSVHEPIPGNPDLAMHGVSCDG